MQHLYDPPAARTPVIHPVRTLAALLPLAGGLALLPLQPLRAQALFGAAELDQSKFVIVAAPIGDGSRAQLNIYEQRTDVRPCFAVQGSNPAVVEPLLSSFDFTGICNRFIDGNGYSVRIGGSDLGTVYRLSVVKEKGDTLLLALPTKAGVGPEMVVARSGGQSNGFLQLLPEPGWKLMRRQFGGRTLGHVYVYREAWPAESSAAPAPVTPAAAAPIAKPSSRSSAKPAKPPSQPPSQPPALGSGS